jgi:hypothetical protein
VFEEKIYQGGIGGKYGAKRCSKFIEISDEEKVIEKRVTIEIIINFAGRGSSNGYSKLVIQT